MLIKFEFFLKKKKDNAKNAPVHWAAGNGSLKCLSFLLSLECDVTLKNSLGDTPLHRAGFCFLENFLFL